ncbi:MAG: hypothetical protein WB239_07540 [Acidimicrobiia bacterium]
MATTQTPARALDTELLRKRLRTWTLATLVTFLLSLVAFVAFMSLGDAFVTLSDSISLLLAVAIVPVVNGLDTLLAPAATPLSRLIRWTGLIGAGLVGAGSIVLLAADLTSLSGTGGLPMQYIGYALIGVWIVISSGFLPRSSLLPRQVTTAAYVAGAGFLLGLLAGPLGPESPVVMLAGLLSVVGFVAWCIFIRSGLANPR